MIKEIKAFVLLILVLTQVMTAKRENFPQKVMINYLLFRYDNGNFVYYITNTYLSAAVFLILLDLLDAS